MNKLMMIGIITVLQFYWWIKWPFLERARYTTTASKLNRLPSMGYGCGEIIKLLNRDYGADMGVVVTSAPRFRMDRYRWTFRYADCTIHVTE